MKLSIKNIADKKIRILVIILLVSLFIIGTCALVARLFYYFAFNNALEDYRTIGEAIYLTVYGLLIISVWSGFLSALILLIWGISKLITSKKKEAVSKVRQSFFLFLT